MNHSKPQLVTVVHTEEEFPWDKPFCRDNTSVSHIDALHELQALYDEHQAAISYSVDYPVCTNPKSAATLRAIIAYGHEVEIGMHCHPWVNPPFEESINTFNSFPGNLPEALEKEKLTLLKIAIQENIGLDPGYYLAGRYGFGEHTARNLLGLGINIDLSPSPYYDYSHDGGPNYLDTPQTIHSNSQTPELLHFPHTTGYIGWACKNGTRPLISHSKMAQKIKLSSVISRLGGFNRVRLSPEGHNLQQLKTLTRDILNKKTNAPLIFSFHSPSISQGLTPYVQSNGDKKRFFKLIQDYLLFFKNDIGGNFSSVKTAVNPYLINNAKKIDT